MSSLTVIIKALYKLVNQLEQSYHGRHFTLDGHLVGSLGEVYAQEKYKLELLPSSAKTHDAKKGKKLIQIKTTQTNRIAISSKPDHLLVLKLQRDGTFEEIYNGPGAKVWKKFEGRNRPHNGQFQISLNILKTWNKEVKKKDRI